MACTGVCQDVPEKTAYNGHAVLIHAQGLRQGM